MRFVAVDALGRTVEATELARQQRELSEACESGNDPETVLDWIQSLLPPDASGCNVYDVQNRLVQFVPKKDRLPVAREPQAPVRYVP